MLSHPYRSVSLNAPIPFTVQEHVPSPDPRSPTPSLTPLTPPPAHYKRRKCDAVIRADLPPTPPPSAPHSPLPKHHHHHHRGNNVDDDDVEDIDDDASEELEWRPPMQHPLPFAVQPPSVSSYITPAMHPDSHTRPPKPHGTHKSRVATGATGASTPSTPSLSASGNPSRISVSSVDTRTPEVYCVYVAPNLQRAGSSASHSSSYYNSGSRSNSGDSTHTAGWHSSSSSSSMASLEPSSDGLSCPYPQAGSSATGGTSSGSRFRKGYSMVVNGPRTGSLRSLFKKGGCEA